jgi:NAD(P)H-flavin reductase
MEYTFEVEFKDKKLRLTYEPGQFWIQGQRAYTYSSFYKDSGELKPIYKDGESSLEETMNDLKTSLINYLNSKKDSDW